MSLSAQHDADAAPPPARLRILVGSIQDELIERILGILVCLPVTSTALARLPVRSLTFSAGIADLTRAGCRGHVSRSSVAGAPSPRIRRVPRIEKRNVQALEIADIACSQRQVVRISGGREEGIHRPERFAHPAGTSGDASPCLRHHHVDGQHASLEALRQVVPDPQLESCSLAPWIEQLDAAMQLGERDNAHEYLILVNVGQPRNNAFRRHRLRPFRHHVGVQQIAHTPTSRGRSRARCTFNRDPRSGDAAKNSAKLPIRLDRRSHSSAGTTTTVRFPLRVTICGPSARARSIIALK